MARYRGRLPQLGADVMLADGGIETDLIFHHGVDLPHFSAFVLLDQYDHRQVLSDYYAGYLNLAHSVDVGLVLETATWRANSDWGDLLGYSAEDLGRVARDAVNLLVDLRAESDLRWPSRARASTVVISGCVGPRTDGFDQVTAMTPEEALRYHAPQIDAFGGSSADLVTGMTIAYAAEAIGITRGAQAAGIPVAISFTVELDGRLPDGTTLADAIRQVDRATNCGPVYYMVNCAHPTHIEAAFAPAPGPGHHPEWLARVRGVRANASLRSHAELAEADELDEGDTAAFGADYQRLCRRWPQLTVLGGCCGTDERHLAEVARQCVPADRAR